MIEIQNEEIIIQGTTLSLTVSIGIAVIDGSINPQRLLSYADIALYSAKEGGKNRIVIIQTDEEKITLSESQSIVLMIKEALRLGNFLLYFQPVYRLDGSLIHYEALVRLYDHEGRIVLPGVFLPVAEKFGLVSLIDRWVVHNAIDILKDNPEMYIFVNISASSLGDEELLKTITNYIKQSGVEANRIGFEITETTAIKDLPRAEHWIRKLKEIGCKFALDDFGVGFSSFTHLHLLPVDFLKIDGSFVRDLDSDYTKRALIKA
ncbi:hypothetical protein N752_18890 [Desulforamulus aquiferis]|nr:hypothetical protein N752_18890 [Desulforamulus aquiferis]